jgi:tRNA threonylcarbamoyl adenosine modification protein YeaZ
MRVLSLDSSTEVASCAIIEDGKLLGEITYNNEKQHSVILMPMIDNLLTTLRMDLKDLDGFVVAKGPGSFTGLRIGMSTVKGLSFGIDKPCIAVSSLDSLAYNLAFADGLICPILDALRDNVYTRLFLCENGDLKPLSDYKVISVEELVSEISKQNKKVYFVGDGIYKHRDKLSSLLPNAFFAPAHLNLTRASALGELGLKLLNSGTAEDLNTVAPIYLRKSQAEREYDKKMGLNENE